MIDDKNKSIKDLSDEQLAELMKKIDSDPFSMLDFSSSTIFEEDTQECEEDLLEIDEDSEEDEDIKGFYIDYNEDDDYLFNEEDDLSVFSDEIDFEFVEEESE